MADDRLRRRRIDTREAPASIVSPDVAARPMTHASLQPALDEVLRSAHTARRPVTLVVAEATGAAGARRPGLADAVRPLVRSSDLLWATGPRSLALVLVDADGPGGEQVLARLRRAAMRTVRPAISFGGATAAPGIGASDLFELAIANLGEGPNRTSIST